MRPSEMCQPTLEQLQARAASRGRRCVVTIDGPAASGKSSVARGVAQKLVIPYVSSGLLYRAATYLVCQHGTDVADEKAIVTMLESHPVLLEARCQAANRVWLQETDLTPQLHTEEIDHHVSAVARHARVRQWVDERLRQLSGPFVIEGRDMGTAVFPEAAFKFYLSATPEVRAARRVGERGAGLAEITQALKRRDELDAKQLVPAPDAQHIDTTRLAIEQVMARVLLGLEVCEHPA